MMNIQLSHVGPPVDERALNELESYVGGAICFEYKGFLLARNGGACRPAVCSALLTHPLAMFLRLQSGGSGGLKNTFDDVNEFRERPQLLPIAKTLGEEYVCIEIGVVAPKVILVSPEGSERVCAASWLEFQDSLTQPPEAPPLLEELAQQPWETVQSYIEAGGEVIPSGELSLLSQAIRAENAELVSKLIEVQTGWGDLDEAMEVAILNKRLDFVKMLVEVGGDTSLAAKLAVGPGREAIRAYLAALSR